MKVSQYFNEQVPDAPKLHKDFDIQFMHYANKSKDLIPLENSVVLIGYEIGKTIEQIEEMNIFKDCLIIYHKTERRILETDSIYFGCPGPSLTYKILVEKYLINTPPESVMDEMALRYRADYQNNVHIQRCLCEEWPTIGRNVIIGADNGFILAPDNQAPTNLPTIGGVKIGKNVIIGNNVVIHRGVTGFTEIGDNVVILDGAIIWGDAVIKPNTCINPFKLIR